jgi:hypothetical protein
LTDNGTGDYTLTFAKAFVRAPIVTVTSATADCIAILNAVSATEVRITLFDCTDGTTAKDGIFHAIVLGYDSADET